jgi:hypothetical protein
VNNHKTKASRPRMDAVRNDIALYFGECWWTASDMRGAVGGRAKDRHEQIVALVAKGLLERKALDAEDPRHRPGGDAYEYRLKYAGGIRVEAARTLEGHVEEGLA